MTKATYLKAAGLIAHAGTEALAALVTPELAELLERLADMAVRIASETEAQYGIDDSLAVKQSGWIETARTLAARIRGACLPQALDEHRNNQAPATGEAGDIG